jgi:hypothetical protein
LVRPKSWKTGKTQNNGRLCFISDHHLWTVISSCEKDVDGRMPTSGPRFSDTLPEN